MNQCDGCRRGLPIEGNIHREANGHGYMVCTKQLYECKYPGCPCPTEYPGHEHLSKTEILIP